MPHNRMKRGALPLAAARRWASCKVGQNSTGVDVYGDYYDEVSAAGPPPAQADVVKPAIVEDEDQPVPRNRIDYFVAQPAVILENPPA